MEIMSIIREVLDTRSELEMQLNAALSTMERKDTIKEIYLQIQAN